MNTNPKNDNDSVIIVATGTSTDTVPYPSPLNHTTDNNNNNNNNTDEEKVTTTLVTTEQPMILSGSDVAAICKLMTHPINDEERQFICRMKTYLAEQGGSDAILQRCSDGGGGGQDHRNNGPGTADGTGIDVDDNSANSINCLLLDRGRIDPANPTRTADDDAEENDCVAGRLLGIYTATTDGTNHPPSSTTSDPPIFIEILSYLDDKSLIEASFVNKPWNASCHSPAMEHAIVPYFQLKLDLSLEKDAITNFVHTMKKQDKKGRFLKDGYQRFELHLIGNRPDGMYGPRDNYLDEMLTLNIRMNGIVSLVVTPSCNEKYKIWLNHYWKFFSKMFPKLRELNVSDSECNRGNLRQMRFYFGSFLFLRNCPYLTKIITQTKDRELLWCGGNIDEKWASLTEIFIDDHIFVFKPNQYEEHRETLQFLNYYSSSYRVLERLSIRNAHYYVDDTPLAQAGIHPYPRKKSIGEKIPQDDLVKFVRNAPPALKWFRSDLSQENIRMLKIEKPNIEFVN